LRCECQAYSFSITRNYALRFQAKFRQNGSQPIEKRRMGYAVFNYEAVSDKFTPDAKSPSDCGYACHTPVKVKDYIFHPYQKR
jgi:hypothetical protein